MIRKIKEHLKNYEVIKKYKIFTWKIIIKYIENCFRFFVEVFLSQFCNFVNCKKEFLKYYLKYIEQLINECFK